MNERIKLKFQKFRLMTTLSWMFLLFLGLISRGVIPTWFFWLLVIFIALLFIGDIVYFVIRIAESHYLLITKQQVILKRVFYQPQSIFIAELEKAFISSEDDGIKRIFLADRKQEIVIKHIYTISKENMVAILKNSPNLPKDFTFTQQ